MKSISSQFAGNRGEQEDDEQSEQSLDHDVLFPSGRHPDGPVENVVTAIWCAGAHSRDPLGFGILVGALAQFILGRDGGRVMTIALVAGLGGSSSAGCCSA